MDFYKPSKLMASLTTGYLGLTLGRSLSLAANYPIYYSHWGEALVSFDPTHILPLLIAVTNYNLL